MTIKILIVEDSSFMRSIIKNILNQLGVIDIVEAVDGADAVTKYQDEKPDLVLMDIIMPKKNGFEALKEILSKDPDAKVVMCTSMGQEKVIREAVEIGAVDYITKPFMPEDFKEVISRVLAQKYHTKYKDKKQKTVKK